MFIGEYEHVLDVKNRTSIPAKFREMLGEKCIITKGLDNCLFIYPLKEWGILEEKLKVLPLTNKDARAFTRFFFSCANEIEFDKQGRFVIPASLKVYANLTKEIVVIGVSNRIELWDKEKWCNYNSPDNLDPDDIAEKMQELGI
jgi:MraZ protein